MGEICKWNISKVFNCKLCLIKRTTQGTYDTFTPLISTNLTWIKATVRIAQIMSCSGSWHSYSNKLQGYHHLSSRTFSFSNLPFVGCWSSLKSEQCDTSSTPCDPFVNKELFSSKVLFTVPPLHLKLFTEITPNKTHNHFGKNWSFLWL